MCPVIEPVVTPLPYTALIPPPPPPLQFNMPYQLASADVLPDTDTAGDSQRYSFPLQVQGGRARGRGGADVRFVRYPG